MTLLETLGAVAALLAILGAFIGVFRWWRHREEAIDQLLNDLHEISHEDDHRLVFIRECIQALLRIYCASESPAEQTKMESIVTLSYQQRFLADFHAKSIEAWITRLERRRPFISLRQNRSRATLESIDTRSYTGHWREMRAGLKESANDAELSKLLETLTERLRDEE